MPRLRTKLIAFLGLFLAPLPTADAFGPTPNPVQHSAESRLMAEFARFATLTDGTVGIAVRDLGTGETLAYNGDTLFPMASTYKLAVAAKILRSEEHTSELQSLMRNSSAVFCLHKKQ